MAAAVCAVHGGEACREAAEGGSRLARAAQSAGPDDASLPSAAASVAATPGAFASRVCADPDCADCAAEFECVACMGGDGEGSCEDEGGVLV